MDSKIVLAIEDRAEFNQLREGLREVYNPKTAYERILFEETARAQWVWSRAQVAHTAVINAIVKQEQKADPKLTAEEAFARVFTEEKHASRMRLVLRYEASAERTYRKCLQQLERFVTSRLKIEHYAAAAKAKPERDMSIGFVSQNAPLAMGAGSAPQRR